MFREVEQCGVLRVGGDEGDRRATSGPLFVFVRSRRGLAEGASAYRRPSIRNDREGAGGTWNRRAEFLLQGVNGKRLYSVRIDRFRTKAPEEAPPLDGSITIRGPGRMLGFQLENLLERNSRISPVVSFVVGSQCERALHPVHGKYGYYSFYKRENVGSQVRVYLGWKTSANRSAVS